MIDMATQEHFNPSECRQVGLFLDPLLEDRMWTNVKDVRERSP